MEKEAPFAKYNEIGYVGFVNLGNTCFLNSCLQILCHTYELNELFQTKKVANYLKKREEKDAGSVLIINEWLNLLNVIWGNKEKRAVVSPNRFVTNIKNIAKMKNRELFTGYNQNDISEFLLFMIDCFHSCIARPVEIKINGNVENQTDELAMKCYSMIQSLYTKEYSEIIDMFYGIYVSEIRSLDETTRFSANPESYFILDLPILFTLREPRKKTIYDCLDHFTAYEILEGDNAWWNEKTKRKEDIKKRMIFFSFPKILTITLKRFSIDGLHKNAEVVEFPLDLNLSKYSHGYNDEQYQYELYGICNHIGDIYNGHYTAFVKNSKGEWVHYNDEIIEVLNEGQIKEIISNPMYNAAYCLFYRKK